MDRRKQRICLEPFIGLSIDKHFGKTTISPCCIGPKRQTEIIDYQNDELLKSVRQAWATGQNIPKECNQCIELESQGLPGPISVVHDYYGHYQKKNIPDAQLVKFEYWVGDLCNLACIGCGPRNSSTWKQELQIPKNLAKRVVNYPWQNTDLSNCKYVHFQGGEPLLDSEHLEFLKMLPQLDQVTVVYNTNGTTKPSSAHIEVWKKCKSVYLNFSVDAVGKQFEYIRYPAKWDHVQNTIAWTIQNKLENMFIGIYQVVYPITQQTQMLVDQWWYDFCEQHGLDRNRTGVYKQPVVGDMSFANTEISLKKLQDIDRRRGLNWKEIFPEAAVVLDQA